MLVDPVQLVVDDVERIIGYRREAGIRRVRDGGQ